MKSIIIKIKIPAIASLLLIAQLQAGFALAEGDPISRSFEMRIVSPQQEANGVTAFKGGNSVLDTEQRVAYLKQYADYGKMFFQDPRLDKLTVTDDEVQKRLKALKPQPLPEIRRRLPLQTWRHYGYKEGQDKERAERLSKWQETDGFTIKDGALLATENGTETLLDLQGQSWRFLIEFRIKPAQAGKRSFKIMGAEGELMLSAGVDSDGRVFYTAAGKTVSGPEIALGSWHNFKLEVDLCKPSHKKLNGHVEPVDLSRYNLYMDDKLLADYVPINDSSIDKAASLAISCVKGDMIDDVWAVSYELRKGWKKDYPFSIDTFIDDDFESRPNVLGWNEAGYDDKHWSVSELPIVHGGERQKQETLYLRKNIAVDEFEKAVLNIEAIDPSGEIWINGQLVKTIKNREPQKIDVSEFLKPGQTNLLAVSVDPFYISKGMHHRPTDKYIGWFAGRMSLDLVSRAHIDDVFAYTESIGDPAVLKVRVKLSGNDMKGLKLGARLARWYPEEDKKICAETASPVPAASAEDAELYLTLKVDDPRIWSCSAPNLYKLQVVLYDGSKPIDDYVLTTGIRTVSQEGGIFRINGEVETLRAPLVFGYRPPLEDIAKRHRCGTEDWLMREILMIKAMNGNGARMTVHHGPYLSINDPRWAEMADQVGFMWIWATTPWVRDGSWKKSDWSGLDKYVRQVYNHPSIVIWQPANHPFYSSWDDGMALYKTIYETIYPLDPSRLISPGADLRYLYRKCKIKPGDDGTTDLDGNPIEPVDPVWTAPMITRGSMDTPTGFGRDWVKLMEWPRPSSWMGDAFMAPMLESKERAYFNFEQEESIGQPNWNLRKGKPHYRLHSYEWSYDRGSIGRLLSCDEWQESQAWQAFSAYEAIRKMRWLDYDGFSWCCLHGGPNTATYQKPLLDYYGHAKLAYYTNRMAFQDVLAGSDNVDMVYGPGDEIRPIVFNLGQARTVSVLVEVKTPDGEVIDSKSYEGVQLPAGRNVTRLDAFKPSFGDDGSYAIEYTVLD